MKFSRLKIKAGGHGHWRGPRTSNPLAGSNKVRGEFDPHALPPIFKSRLF